MSVLDATYLVASMSGMMPKPSDQRYNWVVVRLATIDEVEMREIVLEAWRMVVPMRVASDYGND